MAEKEGIWHALKEVFAKVQEYTFIGGGKLASEMTAETLMLSVAGGSANAAFGLVLAGGFGVVSTVANQMEYNHRRNHVAEFYEEELAAKLKKSGKTIVGKDLSALDEGKDGVETNRTIQEELTKQRWLRNVGIGASFLSSIAAFALVSLVMPPHAAGVGLMVVKGAASLLAYLTIKTPVAKIGATLMGVNYETTHEKIVGIAKDRDRGRSITREQVVDVFVSANKQLADFVEAQFGKPYDKLVLADKVRVAEELQHLLPIDEIAKNITLGVTNASELAFTVDGQASGVAPKLPERTEKESLLQSFSHKCKQMAHSITHMFERKHDYEPVVIAQPPAIKTRIPISFDQLEEPAPSRSFVERVGGKHDTSMGYAKRVRDEQLARVEMPASNTLH